MKAHQNPYPYLTWAFCEPSVIGEGHHNFVVIALMIMKFSTDMKLNVFYTTATKICDVITITYLRRHNLYFTLNFSTRKCGTTSLIWRKFGI